MNVREMLEKSLRENGFDGLVHEEGECACQIGELVPCESDFTSCHPGYKVACQCGNGCDFHITETRLTKREPDESHVAPNPANFFLDQVDE